MKRILLTFAVALLAAGASAQGPIDNPPPFGSEDQSYSVTLIKDYDLDNTSATYCSSLGAANRNGTGGTSRGDYYKSTRKVKNTTSDTAIESFSVTVDNAAFVSLGEGDIVAFYLYDPDTGTYKWEERVVVTKTDDHHIDVNLAIDLSASGGYFYFWRDVVCNTDTGAGEILVGDLQAYQIRVDVDALTVDAGGVDVGIQCRQHGGNFKDLEPTQIVVADATTASWLGRVFDGDGEAYEACRIRIALSDDDEDDTGGAAEKISAWLSGKRKVR